MTELKDIFYFSWHLKKLPVLNFKKLNKLGNLAIKIYAGQFAQTSSKITHD